MTAPPLRFGPFTLDRAKRRLLKDGAVVDLNPRYFDALVLLASAPGDLVTKDRFMAEVWRTTKMEGQTVVEDVVFVETSTDIALEVPANLVPVFVALSPTGAEDPITDTLIESEL